MSIRDRLRDWRLPAAEREAAQQERRAEQAMRRERDNQQRADQRAAALEAEAHRNTAYGPHGDGGGGSVFGGSG
jgi:hypothetical protein